jgi:Asp-tRNA(Asn)/Glu-tRNA(Gln) amidotransferase A subunit family amidase
MIKMGPFTNSAEDAALAYAVIARNDPDHFYSDMYDGVFGPPPPTLSGFELIEDFSDVKLGIFPEWFNDSDIEIREKCYSVVDSLVSKG